MPVATFGAVDTWVLTGSRLYTAPDKPAIDNGVVLIRGGRIAAVGASGSVAVPAGTRTTQCSGGVIAAGFQNHHVHFIGSQWSDARGRSAQELSHALEEMLTRYGFTTVVDLASDRDNTMAMRKRIETGAVRGPRILSVGLPLFPPDGIPSYISHLPPDFLKRLPQPTTVEAAVQQLRENFEHGTDATKLFIATPQTTGIKRMPADIARAAVDETHRRGKLVIAHPTDFDGITAALDAGVDVLAHPALGARTPWPDELLHRVVDAHMSLVPTLQLLPYELRKENVPSDVASRLTTEAGEQVRAFAAAGGQLLFGTDIDYMTEFDPTVEYQLLSRAGLSTSQILASLTTEPAQRWKESTQRGRLDAGMAADIVVLAADPATDAANFAKVRCTFRAGKEIYSAAAAAN